jgi:hypothetical protein
VSPAESRVFFGVFICEPCHPREQSRGLQSRVQSRGPEGPCAPPAPPGAQPKLCPSLARTFVRDIPLASERCFHLLPPCFTSKIDIRYERHLHLPPQECRHAAHVSTLIKISFALAHLEFRLNVHRSHRRLLKFQERPRYPTTACTIVMVAVLAFSKGLSWRFGAPTHVQLAQLRYRVTQSLSSLRPSQKNGESARHTRATI